jgi:hypothetical protein
VNCRRAVACLSLALTVALGVTGCGPAIVPPPSSVLPARAIVLPSHGPAAPVWHVGDEWAFRWESPEGQGEYTWTVNRVERVDGIEHYVVRSGPREIYFRAADLATSLETLSGRVERRNLPPRLGFSWPLSAGAMWRQRYLEEGDGRSPAERAIDWTVEGEEDVRVDGGSFRTLRIAARFHPTPDLVYEMWYAPAAKQWVRLKEYFPAGVRSRELVGLALR